MIALLLQVQLKPLEGSISLRVVVRMASAPCPVSTYWLPSCPAPLRRPCPLDLRGPRLLPPSPSPCHPAAGSRCVCGDAGTVAFWQRRRLQPRPWWPRTLRSAAESPACILHSLRENRFKEWIIKIHPTQLVSAATTWLCLILLPLQKETPICLVPTACGYARLDADHVTHPCVCSILRCHSRCSFRSVLSPDSTAASCSRYLKKFWGNGRQTRCLIVMDHEN